LGGVALGVHDPELAVLLLKGQRRTFVRGEFAKAALQPLVPLGTFQRTSAGVPESGISMATSIVSMRRLRSPARSRSIAISQVIGLALLPQDTQADAKKLRRGE